MFKYKTEKELQEMTAEERDNYATEKREFEAEQVKKQVDEAVKHFKEKAEKEAEAAKKETEKAEADRKKQLDDLQATVKTQGEKIVELNKAKAENPTMKKLADVFKEKYDEFKGERDEFPKGEQLVFDTKDIASDDVMSVDDVSSGAFPAAGTTGIVTSAMQTMFGKLIGYFGLRKPTSRILDLIDVMPMDNATLIAINDEVIGDAEVTPECTLKSIVRYEPAVQESTADAVTAMWFTTTKLRRFFPVLVNRMQMKFAELVNDKIPAVVLTAVKAGATAFTPIPELAINSNPNNYDAIGAVIATIENLGYMPTAIILNPVAWRNMKQEKTSDGVYTLSNGQSISILQNGLDWGGASIPIIKDPTLGIDEFIVGDLFTTVKAGVDTQLMYMETDGRTDAAATNATTGLARNIRTHVLEKFFGIIIPDATNVLIVSDTFSNVKTLITAEEDTPSL